MKKTLLSAAVTAATVTGTMTTIHAQQVMAQEVESATRPPMIEEIIAVGRLQSSADEVMMERRENEVVADYIDTSSINRVGDSNVAAALRRVPGVTLIDDKYVFVRGLGERYSTSLLNGAQIPSPDLTRNVIPLDIFPTSIVRSIAVQKGYTADMPASFSGGLIDIRTTSIPMGLEYSFEFGSDMNTETRGNSLTYNGGGDDWLGVDDGSRELSPSLHNALNTYRGSLNSLSILDTLNANGGRNTLADAREVNRQLATSLNRDITIWEESPNPNFSLEGNVGNNFYFDNGMEVGFLTAAAYSSSHRSRSRTDRSFGDPAEIFTRTDQGVQNVNLTGNVNLGWRWYDEHSIETTSLLLRNTDDEAFIQDYYTSSSNYSGGAGFRNYGVRFEARELKVNQVHGSHTMGHVIRDLTGFSGLQWSDGLTIDWFYSDATSTTDIPNEATVTYRTNVDPATGRLLSQRLQGGQTAGDFRFTELDDEVENYGWNATLPIYLRYTDIEVSGGYNYSRKVRDYKQLQFGLGTGDALVAASLDGMPSGIFADDVILDDANSFVFDVQGNNGESYIAAISNSAAYTKIDAIYDETWRLTAGVRWEDYAQIGIPWNPLNYRGCQISCDPMQILASTYKNDDFYPSLALTWMRPGFMAEDFQLRLGYSETLVRPDLREITPSSYFDPITGALVSGNANVVPSSVRNYDLRGEWYFANGDNVSASLFYKDLTDPIDLFEAAAFEEARATEIQNGASAEVYGLEVDFLKALDFLGGPFEQFFLAGNLTLLESELVAGASADAPTNPVRPLAGASDAMNLQLGWDSYGGEHSAMLVYNVFSDRLYFAGRNGSPDAYESPFHSLDLTYFWYPTDNWVFRVRAQNILDEEVEVERAEVITFNEKSGTSLSLDIKWRY